MRVGVIGLGQIAELCLPPYAARDDVEVVALCDLDKDRLERWHAVFPTAVVTHEIDDVLAAGPDVVDVLVPTPFHGDVTTRVLAAGVDVQVQKPLARSVEDADRMLEAAAQSGATIRVLEDYMFYPPLVMLRDVVASGEIGTPTGMHMKIVGTGRGGWDVPLSSYIWQFEQSRDGRGMLTFDHGWHQIAIAHWLFGPITRIFGWIGETQAAPDLAPEIMIDAPATFVWEHANGVRATLEILLASETLFRSDFYSCDERVEVTGSQGYVRCNRISSKGVQEPSVVVYREGEVREYHALDDDPPDAFAASAAHAVDYFDHGRGPLVMDGAAARAVLVALLAGLDSSKLGRPVDVGP